MWLNYSQWVRRPKIKFGFIKGTDPPASCTTGRESPWARSSGPGRVTAETCTEAMSKKKAGKREDWEDLDVNADSRLPASHGIIFMINSLVLAAASVCKFWKLLRRSGQRVFWLLFVPHRPFLHNIRFDSWGECNMVRRSQCNLSYHPDTGPSKPLKEPPESVIVKNADLMQSPILTIFMDLKQIDCFPRSGIGEYSSAQKQGFFGWKIQAPPSGLFGSVELRCGGTVCIYSALAWILKCSPRFWS